MRARWFLAAATAAVLAGVWLSSEPAVRPPVERPEAERPEAERPEVVRQVEPHPRDEPRPTPLTAITPRPAPVETASVAEDDQIREALAETFRARYPERRITDQELDRMAAALTRLTRARAALNALRYDSAEGGELRRLRDEIGEAVAEFETVSRVPLSRFTEEATEEGISR